VRVQVTVDGDENLPGLQLRVHKARESRHGIAVGSVASDGYVDMDLNHTFEPRLTI
jgi:hypothetical protein